MKLLPFPLVVFPPSIRDIVESLVMYERFNIDFTAAAMFATFATAMGSRWRVKFTTTWTETPIVYMVLVGPPSCGKTPPLKLSLAPLFRLEDEYDRDYGEVMKRYQQWELKSPKERTALGLPEEMEHPKRKCHVVVNTTIEALIGAMRDNPQGVILYNDEIDSLLSNFNRYSNGSDEGYFLSAFSGTTIKYTRKSNDEYISLSNPYCSIIGGTQPGLLAGQFGGKRTTNGFSSRFLKVYPQINRMPAWMDSRMPEEVMEEWNRIIRKVVTFDFKGKVSAQELTFSSEAMMRLCRWKDTNNDIYSATESEAVQALCGKLETYLLRFALIIQVMKAVCSDGSSDEVDDESVSAAIELVEYFRQMENRVISVTSTGNLDSRYTDFLETLPENFKTSDAITLGKVSGLSESSVKRFLKNSALFRKTEHGCYLKISHDP